MSQQIPPIVRQLPVGPVKPVNRDRIGHILSDMRKLSAEDRERVRKLQDESGMRFGEAAARLGIVTEDDVQQALALQFGYPYLQPGRAEYPPELVAAYQPFSEQVETLRAIRSQLLLRWFARGHKALVVFSVNSGEGASFFAANLAVLFAQLDRETLLIDANLRRPRLHEIFNLKNKQGLSEILAGRCDDDSLAAVEAFPNLSVLPSGPLPPNPQELVSRRKFREWTDDIGRRFNIVLIDVAAFSSAADALAIAASIGGAVLVARKHVSRISDIGAVGAQLDSVGAELVGSVVVEF
jgi:chain length determinant protein tyrosine kinase EpsG